MPDEVFFHAVAQRISQPLYGGLIIEYPDIHVAATPDVAAPAVDLVRDFGNLTIDVLHKISQSPGGLRDDVEVAVSAHVDEGHKIHAGSQLLGATENSQYAIVQLRTGSKQSPALNGSDGELVEGAWNDVPWISTHARAE